MEELDLESIVNANEDAERRKHLESELAAVRGELSSTTILMEKTYELLNAGASTDFVAGKLKALTIRQSTLRDRQAAKEAEQQEFNARDSRFYSSREDIKNLVRQLQQSASDEIYRLRAQIASRLKVLVETLLIAPQGALPKMKRTIDELQKIIEDKPDEVLEYMRRLAAHPEQSRRYFAIGFRDAAVRVVFPAYDDPLKFDHQVLAGSLPMSDEEQELGRISFIDELSPEN